MLQSSAPYARHGGTPAGARSTPNLASFNQLLDWTSIGPQEASKRSHPLPPLDSLAPAQQQAVAQQLVARMTPEQQALVAHLPEREQLHVLSNFYERLFIPPRAPPWQPSGAVLAALMQQRREHSAAEAKAALLAQQQQMQPGSAGPIAVGAARLPGQVAPPTGPPRPAHEIAALARAAAAVATGIAPDASTDELSRLQVLAALAESPSPAPDFSESSPSKRLRMDWVADATAAANDSHLASAAAATARGAQPSPTPGPSPAQHLAEALLKQEQGHEPPASMATGAAAAAAAAAGVVEALALQPPVAPENCWSADTDMQQQQGQGQHQEQQQQQTGQQQKGQPPQQPQQQGEGLARMVLGVGERELPTALQVWAELRPYVLPEGAADESRVEAAALPLTPPQQQQQQQEAGGAPSPTERGEAEGEKRQAAKDAASASAKGQGQLQEAQTERDENDKFGSPQSQPQQPEHQQQPVPLQRQCQQPGATPRFLNTQLLARFCAAYASHPRAQRLEELALIRALIGQGELRGAKAAMGFFAGMMC